MATFLQELEKSDHIDFFTILVKKYVEKNSCVLCLLQITLIHYHTQLQEISSP